MKILVVTWACDRDDVSEPEISYRWVNEIAKRHKVVLFAVSRPDRLGCVKAQFPTLEVIEWSDVWVPKVFERFRAIVKPGYLLYFNRARRLLKSVVEEQHFDIIHHLNPFAWRYPSPAFGLGVPFIRGPVAGGLTTPTSMQSEISEIFHPYKFLRFTDNWRKMLDPVLRASYQGTDCVIAAAPYVTELLKPLPIRRMEIEIEHGLQYPTKRHLIVRRDRKAKIRLLFVGRIVRTKGVREAICSLIHIKNIEKVELVIIGDGEDLSVCIKLVNELQLDEKVTFRGWCSKQEVEKAYLDADIFVFPSFREPTGGVILEAMAHSLPCIVCDYGGPGYMVNENFGFKIVPKSSEELIQEIANKIDLLIDDIGLRSKMGIVAYNCALENFEWTEKMNRIDIIYKSLVKVETI